MIISTFIALLIIGLLAGILSGIFGIGGGVIIVPALIYLLRYSTHKGLIVSRSIPILIPSIASSSVSNPSLTYALGGGEYPRL